MTRPTDARPVPSDYERGAADMQERAADVCEAAYARQQRANGTVGGPLATACMEIAGLPILPDPSAPAQPQQPGGEEALVPWPDPTPAMLADPMFEAIWQAIKSWDVNVPDQYAGYCGATGNHARRILDAIAAMRAAHGEPDVRAQALEEAVAACHQVAAGDNEDGGWWAAEGAGQCAAAIRALIAAPPPVPSHDHHLSAWREGVEAAAVVLDALGDHSHGKGTLSGALAALCASQCAQHVRDFGAQGRPDLARPVPPAGATP